MSIDACKFINKFLDGIIIQLDTDNTLMLYEDDEFYIFLRENNLLLDGDRYTVDHDKVSEFIMNENNIKMTKKLFIDLIQGTDHFLHFDPSDCDCGWVGYGMDEEYDLTDKEKEIYAKISNMDITHYEELFEAFEN